MSRTLWKAVAAAVPAFFLCNALLTAAPAPSGMAEPWDGAPFAGDPAAIARAAAQAQGGAGDDVIVLLNEAHYRYDEAGRETYTKRLVYRILTPRAHESWSAVEEGWAPWHQDRPEIRARVITPDGVAHPLDPAVLAENGNAPGAPDMFEDGRVLRGPLPATGPGAVVEQLVTVRDRAPFFDGGVVRFQTFNLTPGVAIRHVRLVLDAPASLPLRHVARKLPGVAPREITSGGRRQWVFEIRDLEPLPPPETSLPSTEPRIPYVAFSTGQSWGELARRYSEIVDQAIRGADLSAVLQTAGGPAASQVETINRLLARISAEVRYSGVELGAGSLIPRPPGETLRRKFGDCKDKAVLLAALLRASDIPAYVALLNAGEGSPDVEESLPGFGAFNHAILVVPGNPAIWIDPTDPYARAGELPVADQGRWALIASPTATGLTRTPEATSAQNREVENREFFLADLGPARIVESSEFTGASERALRAYYSSLDDPAIRQEIEGYAREAYLSESLGKVEHSKLSDLSSPLRLRVELNGRRGFTDTRNAAVGINPAALLARLPDDLTGIEEEEPAPRRADYVFTRPLTLEIRYRIVPPEGFAPRALPQSRQRGFGTVTLAEKYAAAPDGVVTASFRLDSGKRRLTPQEFEVTRKAVREALEEQTSLVMFDQVGEAHLDAGRVREALAEFQRLAALAPKQALPRTRIARALLAGGMGEAAREEARRAIQLEPGFALAHRDYAWILQHDALGRRFGQGFDRAGSLAAYRQARKLDPQDEIARIDLAILLEHDDKGVRYSPKADLPGAIEEYKALRKDLDNHSTDQNLLMALLRAERFGEMRELAKEMKDSTDGPVISLVATAVLESAEAAIRQSEREISDDQSRSAALHSAGQNLIVVRRYTEAAALFERAGRQSSNAAVLLTLADVLRRTRRTEELPALATSPGTPVRRLMELAASGQRDVRQLAALFSGDMASQILSGGEAAAQQFEAGAAEGLKTLQDRNIPLAAAIDIGRSTLRENLTGDDALGYRVSFSSALDGGGGSAALRAYVVREGSEYRITAMNSLVDRMADEALRRIQKGDLAGARQWLDWALDEVGRDNGKDALPWNPFLALWTRGSQAGAEEIRCAAASLLAFETEESQKALPILLACREAAQEDARRNALDVALAFNYGGQERPAELETVLRRLLTVAPDSNRANLLYVAYLERQRRWDEIRATAERRLQRDPKDAFGLRLLFQEAVRARDLARVEKQLQAMIDADEVSAGEFNQAAWLRLWSGQADDKAVEYGQRAVTLSGYENPTHLHTLAAVYADQGKTGEAYRLIVQSLAATPDGTPESHDWYVFGRLAEHYGLPDVARKYYKRVDPSREVPGDPLPTSDLVRRRLAALGDGGSQPQARSGS